MTLLWLSTVFNQNRTLRVYVPKMKCVKGIHERVLSKIPIRPVTKVGRWIRKTTASVSLLGMSLFCLFSSQSSFFFHIIVVAFSMISSSYGWCAIAMTLAGTLSAVPSGITVMIWMPIRKAFGRPCCFPFRKTVSWRTRILQSLA